eukprot:gene9596-12924_t
MDQSKTSSNKNRNQNENKFQNIIEFAIIAAIIVTLSTIIINYNAELISFISNSPINKSNFPAASKPYSTFAEFYPFYISQHQNTINRRLHFVGSSIVVILYLLNPIKITACGLLASYFGYAISIATRSIDHGLYEMIATFGLFNLLMRYSSKSWANGFSLLFIGYAFAWVGHFYFELNKPATFIYPIYSLAGDFKLWYEIITRTREF